MNLNSTLLIYMFVILTLSLNAQRYDEIHKIKLSGIDSIGEYYLFHFKNYDKIESTFKVGKNDERVARLKTSILTRKKIRIKLIKIHQFKTEDGLVLRSNRALIGDIYYLDGRLQMPYVDAPEIFNYEDSKLVYGIQ